MVMGHHVVSLDKELKLPCTFYKDFYCYPKSNYPDMMATIQEVTFHIQLAYEYNELTKKSNAIVYVEPILQQEQIIFTCDHCDQLWLW